MRLLFLLFLTLCAALSVAAAPLRGQPNTLVRDPLHRRGPRRCRPRRNSSAGAAASSTSSSPSSTSSPSWSWSSSSVSSNHSPPPVSSPGGMHWGEAGSGQSWSQSPSWSSKPSKSSRPWGKPSSSAGSWGSGSTRSKSNSWGSSSTSGSSWNSGSSGSGSSDSGSSSWGSSSSDSGSSSGSGSSGNSGGSGNNDKMFAVYNNAWQSNGVPSTPPKGVSHFILAFWTSTSGPVDAAMAWSQASSSQRKQIKQAYSKAGVKLMVSAFGSTDYPIVSGQDASQIGEKLAKFVKQYDLDGVDIDFEDSGSFQNGKAVDWLVTLHKTLRKQLLQGQYIITHAPQAPYFSSQCQWGAGYSKIHQQVGDSIDKYLVQFYNQGQGMYDTCDSLMNQSSNICPGSSMGEINSQEHIPMEKLVVGKPATQADASTGYMSASDLGSCIASHKDIGGLMYWQYKNLGNVLSTARGKAGW